MSDKYLAHISEDREQTVLEHCVNVSNYAELEAKRIGLGSTLKIAGLFHDIGKLTDEFNRYIHKAAEDPKSVKRGSINHSSAGAKYIVEFGTKNNISSKVTEMIAYAIFSHHGLNDCIDENGVDKFTPRLEVDEYNYNNILKQIDNFIDSKDLMKLLGESEKEINHLFQEIKKICMRMQPIKNENAHFLLGCAERLILSYLVDADRRDTAEFMQGTKNYRKNQKELNELWTNYKKKLNFKLDSFKERNKIDKLRKQMSDYCFDFAKNGNGIYRLSIPTGGGKTLSSMRYALELARKENKEHIIYVAPYLSILEQNAHEIKTIFNDDENILEHHSNVCIDENDTEQLNRHELLVDDWSAPIIMTTTVQFLNTLFDGSMQSVRKLHQLTHSIIIIDEAQSIPIKCLNLFTSFMNFLSYYGNSTVVMCTATQPLFEKINRPLIYNENHKDMIPDIDYFSNEFKRVHIERPDYKEYDYESLAHFILEKMDQNILAVLNTKGAVRGVFEEVKKIVDDDVNVVQLTTYMCAQHRLDIISNMKETLSTKKTICISTQLIEAGVDISFQTVIRSMAGLDSITQAAGRCNRNGETAEGIVYMVNVKESLDQLRDIRDSIEATKRVLDDYKGDLLLPEATEKYYQRYYYPKMSEKYQNKPMDYCVGNTHFVKDLFHYLSINRSIPNYKYTLHQAFKYAGKKFGVIDKGNTIGLITQYGNAIPIVEEMKENPYDISLVKKCLKKLQRYTINVYQTDTRFRELMERNAITRFDDDILILDEGYYTEDEGLTTELPLEVF